MGSTLDQDVCCCDLRLREWTRLWRTFNPPLLLHLPFPVTQLPPTSELGSQSIGRLDLGQQWV